MLMTTILWCRRGRRGAEFQKIPGVELASSSAGSREFHCWNSSVPLLEVESSTSWNSIMLPVIHYVMTSSHRYKDLSSMTWWPVLDDMTACPRWHDVLFSMTWRPVLDDMTACSRWQDGLSSMTWRPVLDDKTICSQCYLLSNEIAEKSTAKWICFEKSTAIYIFDVEWVTKVCSRFSWLFHVFITREHVRVMDKNNVRRSYSIENRCRVLYL